jgi:hypothetical protein
MGVYFVIRESKENWEERKLFIFICIVQNKEIVNDSLMIYTSDRLILRTLCWACAVFVIFIHQSVDGDQPFLTD